MAGSSKPIVHLIVALLLALVAGYLTIVWLAGQKTPPPPPPAAEEKPASPEVRVVAASVAVSRGEKLGPSNLKTVPYFKEAVPEGAFTDPAPLAGRMAAQPIGVGEPVTEAKLFPEGQGAVEAVIKPGKRAVTIKSTRALTDVAGTVAVGSRVDVVAVVNEPGEGSQRMAKVVLENILVLAVNREFEGEKKGAGGREPLSLPDYFTLEVEPRQAEILHQVGQQGNLFFALRNPTDAREVETSGSRTATLFEEYKREPKGHVPFFSTQIRGTQSSAVDVNLKGAQQGASKDAQPQEKKP